MGANEQNRRAGAGLNSAAGHTAQASAWTREAVGQVQLAERYAADDRDDLATSMLMAADATMSRAVAETAAAARDATEVAHLSPRLRAAA